MKVSYLPLKYSLRSSLAILCSVFLCILSMKYSAILDPSLIVYRIITSSKDFAEELLVISLYTLQLYHSFIQLNALFIFIAILVAGILMKLALSQTESILLPRNTINVLSFGSRKMFANDPSKNHGSPDSKTVLINKNGEKTNLQPVLVNSFISILFTNFQSDSERYEITFSKHVRIPDQDCLLIDINTLEKTLNILLSSALQNANTIEKVCLSVCYDGDQVCFVVSLSNNNLARELMPHNSKLITKSFRTNVISNVEKYVSNVKSNLHLTSGSNTIFFEFKLPYKQVDSSTISYNFHQQHMLETPETIKGMCVLIVENNNHMGQHLSGLLGKNFRCYLAKNSKDALEILQHKKVDLIISELMLPNLNGIELLKTIKASDQYQSIPVIILTSLKSEVTRLKVLKMGVDDYLSKPYNPGELLVRTRNLLLRNQLSFAESKNNVSLSGEQQTNNEFINEGVQFGSHAISGGQNNRSNSEWLQLVDEEIRKELGNNDFKLPDLAERFHLSNSQFARRIKNITGLTPKKYQQEIALKVAKQLLEKGTYGKVSAVAYTVGINNVARFSKLYETHYGKRPSTYFSK